jgi:adiponectin receptor
MALLASALYMHNETVNIWTHLGAFLYLLFVDSHYTHTVMLKDAVYEDHLIFFLFYLGAYVCLLMSASFHTFRGHCCASNVKSAVSLDYVGISALIAASVSSIVWFTFYCNDTLKYAYLSIAVTAGLVGIIMPAFAWFDKPAYRPYRMLVFCLQAFIGLVPFAYLLYEHNLALIWVVVKPLTVSVLAYWTGMFFYAARFPERWFPGQFDYLGASHQLWHIGVVCGIWYFKEAMLIMYQSRMDFGIGCSSIY